MIATGRYEFYYDPCLRRSRQIYRLFIAKSFTFRLANSPRRAFAVVYLAIIPAEIKLGNVPMEMLAANIVKCAHDAALEQGERGFDSIAVRTVRLRVLVARVIGVPMLCKLSRNRTLPIDHRAIGHQVGIARHVVRKDATDVLRCHVYRNK